MNEETIQKLERHGIKPSAQRLAVADYVLETGEHPTAERVWTEAKARLPLVSRATVYNTLNLFVDKGLLRQHVLAEGHVVFDPKLGPHHHFVDHESGEIVDIEWDMLRVDGIGRLPGLDVREYQVVLHGYKEQG